MQSLSTSLSKGYSEGNVNSNFIPVNPKLTSVKEVNTALQERLNQIAKGVQQRQNNIGFASGAALRNAWDTYAAGTEKKRNINKVDGSNKVNPENKINGNSIAFSDIYEKLFSQSTLRIVYVELDPGVDDGAALLQLLAAIDGDQTTKKIEIVGIVPCVGNAILSQTAINTRQFLELTKKLNIPVFPGAIAPLAIENDPQSILEMEKGINSTHFYGHDGEEDVGGWPKVTIPMQKTPGYKFTANSVAQATPETALTFVSTSSLTELAKVVDEIQLLEQQNGVPAGTYAKNINAISIMGGCLNPDVGCNAPFNVTHKISEANFYFDSPAARKVFAYCQKYGVPIILAPLDLTQQPGLMWTHAENDLLKGINNSVSNQFARVTEVIPYIDAKNFPNGTYPMHDLFAAVGILLPKLFNVTREAITIGDVGQTIIDTNAPASARNVYILSVPKEKQAQFYPLVLKEYSNFDCSVDKRCTNHNGLYLGIAFLAFSVVIIAIGIFQCIFGRDTKPENDPLMSGQT